MCDVLCAIVGGAGKMAAWLVVVFVVIAALAGNLSWTGEFGILMSLLFFGMFVAAFSVLSIFGKYTDKLRVRVVVSVALAGVVAVTAVTAYHLGTRLTEDHRQRRDTLAQTTLSNIVGTHLRTDAEKYLLSAAYDGHEDLRLVFLWYAPRPGIADRGKLSMERHDDPGRTPHIAFINDSPVPVHEGLNVFYAFDIYPAMRVRVDAETAAWIAARMPKFPSNDLPELHERIMKSLPRAPAANSE